MATFSVISSPITKINTITPLPSTITNANDGALASTTDNTTTTNITVTSIYC